MRRFIWLAFASVCACDGGGAGAENSTFPTANGYPPIVPQQDTESCTNTNMCLYGTVRTSGYTSSPLSVLATLYRVFPLSAPDGTPPIPIAAQIVARDGTWAFDAQTPPQSGATDAQAASTTPLDAWAHYYVEFVPTFSAGQSHAAATRIGPLALPSDAGGPIGVQLEPVQLEVLEESATGQPLALEAAAALLFDPSTGDEVQSGASVSILVGTTPTPMPWGTIAGTEMGYYVQFPQPGGQAPSAQAMYAVTTSLPGASPTTWHLAANTTAIAGAISSPLAGSSVPVGADLSVSWAPQPQADYALVQVFQSQAGSTTKFQPTPLYSSPTVLAGDAATATIPGAVLATAGAYLLNVQYNTANCPPASDGCVIASSVANEVITAQ